MKITISKTEKEDQEIKVEEDSVEDLEKKVVSVVVTIEIEKKVASEAAIEVKAISEEVVVDSEVEDSQEKLKM
jgi:hypothetical protein